MNDEQLSGLDIRGTEATGLTVDRAWNVGKALADWLPTAGSVVVTMIPSQKQLAAAVTEGLRLQGRNVVDGGTSGREGAVSYIKTMGLSGGVSVGYDELEQVSVIELYKEDGRLIDSQTGLAEIDELVRAGNFVPAAVKGELTAIA
jgi:phosphomannomutase/phosphoglucomutase